MSSWSENSVLSKGDRPRLYKNISSVQLYLFDSIQLFNLYDFNVTSKIL